MSLWLPDSTREQLAQDNSEIMQMVMIDEAIQHFTRELKRIDADLELVKASNNAKAPGLVPGYWHILRKGMPCNVLPLEGPNGEFREPGSWMYEWMESQDLWNDRAQKENRRRQKDIIAARDREKSRERQDRIDELNERWHSANHVSLSMTDVKRPWRAAAKARVG